MAWSGHGRLNALRKTAAAAAAAAASAATLAEPTRTTPVTLSKPAAHSININCNIIISGRIKSISRITTAKISVVENGRKSQPRVL